MGCPPWPCFIRKKELAVRALAKHHIVNFKRNIHRATDPGQFLELMERKEEAHLNMLWI